MNWKKIIIRGTIIAAVFILVILVGHITIIETIESQRECIIITLNSTLCYYLNGML